MLLMCWLKFGCDASGSVLVVEQISFTLVDSGKSIFALPWRGGRVG